MTDGHVTVEVGKDSRSFFTPVAPALSAPGHAKALAFDFLARQLGAEVKTLTPAAVIAALSNHFKICPNAAITVSRGVADSVRRQFFDVECWRTRVLKME